MVKYWLEMLHHVIYAIELFWVGECIFRNSVKDWKRYVVTIIVYVVSMSLAGDKQLIVATILEISIYIFLFQEKMKQKIICFIEIYLVTGIIEVVVGGVLALIPNELLRYNSVTGSFISTIVSAILVCGMVRKKWFQSFFQYLRLLKWFQQGVIVIIVICVTLLLVISEFVLDMIDNVRVGMVFHGVSIILCSAIMGGIIWLVRGVYKEDYYLKQNRLKEQIIYAQKEHYQTMYENDKELRRFRHDIKSQLGCINLLLEEGKTEQAQKYLISIEDDFNRKNTYNIHTGNDILDVVLNYMYAHAQQKNIILDVRGTISNIEFIDVYDLCTIFSNAINNAIEACDRLSGVKKIIRISILEQEKTIFFQFENPATMEMYEAIKQKRTTKNDNKNHGFGIENIRRAVEEHSGELEYIYKNEKITLEIYFET